MPAPSIAASASNTAAATNTCTVSITPSGSNRALLIKISPTDNTPPTISSVVFNTSENASSLGDSGIVQTFIRNGWWVLVNPTATTANVVVTLSAAASQWGVIVEAWQDVDQTTPFGSVTFANGTGQTPDPTVTIGSGSAAKTATDHLVRIANTQTVGAGQTQAQQALASSITTLASSTEAGASSVTMSWADAGSGTVSAWEWCIGAAFANEPSVGSGPTINAHPVQQVAASGATATFTVSATTSGGALSYQWRRNGSNVGTNSSSYTTGTLSSSDNRAWFDCDVTDSNGTVRTQRAYLIVAPAAISGKALGYGRLWGWFNDVESTRNGRSFALLRKQIAPWNAASSGIQATVFSDWAFDTSANNVSVGLTGSLVTVSAGTLTPVGADRAYGLARKPGPGVGPFNDNQFVAPPRSAVPPAVSPDVSATLTGSAVTVSAGTLSPATAVTLNGQAVTASAGTLTPSLSLALTGSQATVSEGTLTPATALALSGAVVTGSAGTITPATAPTLLGELVTISTGTITAGTGSDVSVALTGSAVTVSAGTLGVVSDSTVALTGQAVTTSAGTLGVASSVALLGQAVTSAAGTLVPASSVALSGELVSVAAGTLTAQVTGDVAVALTGTLVTVSAGTLVASGGDADEQASGGFLSAYDAWRAAQDRRRARQKRAEEDAQQEAASPVDAEIGTLLRARIAEQEQAAELSRLRALVAERAAEAQAEIDSDRVRAAFERAATVQTDAALEALARELARMREEEEFALLLILAAA